MKKNTYKYHEYIDTYLDGIKNNELIVGKYIKKLPAIVEKELNKNNVFIDTDKIYDTRRGIEEHSDITLYDWELFVIGVMHCYATDDPVAVMPGILLLLGW